MPQNRWYKFLLVASFCEMCAWSILVPYLVWQQWSGYLAIGLAVWWAIGYWPAAIKTIKVYRHINKLMKEEEAILAELEEIDRQERALQDEEEELNMGNIPDGWGENGPFSAN